MHQCSCPEGYSRPNCEIGKWSRHKESPFLLCLLNSNTLRDLEKVKLSSSVKTCAPSSSVALETSHSSCSSVLGVADCIGAACAGQ